MRKRFLLVIAICLLLVPMQVWAAVGDGAGDDYKSLNLEETLQEEEIETAFSNYKETDDQVIIYLFRGKGCAYCRAFLSYINSLVDEYGDYFKLVSYEVWNDTNNSSLFDKVATFIEGSAADGVPYVIIGDEVFTGYTKSYNEEIKNAIMKAYVSKVKYDVFEEMAINGTKPTIYSVGDTSSLDTNNLIGIIWNAVLVAVGTLIIIVYVHNKDKNMSRRLIRLEDLLIENNNKNV